MNNVHISASILAADFTRLGEEVDAVLAAGADMIHVDVMDNHFVPNLSVGPQICRDLRKRGVTTPLDVHLMVSHFDRMIPVFAEAGASMISFHIEAGMRIEHYLKEIRSLNCKAGLAFKPNTSLKFLNRYLDYVDYVLIMSVEPGFGGQAFMPDALDRIAEAKAIIGKRDIVIQVDGGINESNIDDVVNAGANNIVMGSAIFGQDDYGKVLRRP